MELQELQTWLYKTGYQGWLPSHGHLPDKTKIFRVIQVIFQLKFQSWLLSQAIGAIFTPVRNIHFYFTYVLWKRKEKHSESEISQIFKFMHAATFSWTEYQ